MLSFRNCFCILTISLFVCGNALAEFRVAIADVNKIINECPESKEMKKTLDEKTEKARKQIEAKKQALESVKQKIDEGKIKQDSKEADKFRADARDFSRLLNDAKEDLHRDFLKSNQVLTEKVLGLIKDYAQKNRIDLVLDRSEVSRGPVLFGSPSFDITDDIIKGIK